MADWSISQGSGPSRWSAAALGASTTAPRVTEPMQRATPARSAFLEAGASEGAGPDSPDLSQPNVSKASATAFDVVIVGETGFIGCSIARRLAADGASVAVVAERIGSDSALSRIEGVRCLEADISRPTELCDRLEGARIVVNAVSTPIYADWPKTLAAVEEQIEALTHACLNGSPKGLIHLGSTASLYLGSSKARITGSTPPDPSATRRSLYSRAKAAADVMLLQRNHDRGLPVCILRPGIVVGEGGTPYHSCVGRFVDEQYCLGWNMGRNPLPFVWVEDLANAVVATCKRGHLEGQCYNIVGDVRLSAREYVSELAGAMGRPIHFQPQRVAGLYLAELGKWALAGDGGPRSRPPSYRDLKSLGLTAFFDCEDAKRELDWKPLADRDAFVEQCIRVHAATDASR